MLDLVSPTDTSISTKDHGQALHAYNPNGGLHLSFSFASEAESQKSKGEDESTSSEITYYQLLSRNRDYRLFITSYLITCIGEWLTYIASIDFIQDHQQVVDENGEITSSGTAIGMLIVVRLLPNVVLACFGGTLADIVDRRKTLIALDVLGSLVALLFILAYVWDSIFLIYAATLLQQCVTGLYQPTHNAIIPQMCHDDAELKKATTLNELTWSAMQAFGAAASGFIVDMVGSKACFLIDSSTYLASAVLLWMIRGKYDPPVDQSQEHETSCEQLKNMTVGGAQYLTSSFFGGLVFLKAMAALAYGACDVLNVKFSELGADDDNTGLRLGFLFSVVGIGCMIGPLIAETCVIAERPQSMQTICIVGFALSTIGFLGWYMIRKFWVICAFAMIRSAGSAIVWINSTLLLQKFSSERMMGRVMAADYALALLTEAFSAYACGFLMEHVGYSAYEISYILAIMSTVTTVVWMWYHISGRGAGRYNNLDDIPDKDIIGKDDDDNSVVVVVSEEMHSDYINRADLAYENNPYSMTTMPSALAMEARPRIW